MKQFAEKIADGDLEFKLPMDRGNYFGAFTESFDLMREELIRARQGEYEANIRKKELVAELSHDIKTARRANRILYLKDGVIIAELNLGTYVKDDQERHQILREFLESMGW